MIKCLPVFNSPQFKKKKKSNKKRKIKRWIAPGIFSAAITKAVSVYGVPIAE